MESAPDGFGGLSEFSPSRKQPWSNNSKTVIAQLALGPGPSFTEPSTMTKEGSSMKSTQMEQTKTSFNIVVVGETGAGKSSVVNLLAGQSAAAVSSDVAGCTRAPALYDITFETTNFHIYDTTGFRPLNSSDSQQSEPFNQASDLVGSLDSKVDLLLCVHADEATTALRNIYRFFDEFLFLGAVPIALVVTHREKEEKLEAWWERNSETLAEYGLLFASHVCICAAPSNGVDDALYLQSRDALMEILHQCTEAHSQLKIEATTPTHSLLPRISDPTKVLIERCGLDAGVAVDVLRGIRSSSVAVNRTMNLVLFGEAGVGKSSVINLLAGEKIADTHSGAMGCTFESREYLLHFGTRQLRIFDTAGLNEPELTAGGYMSSFEKAHALVRTLRESGGIDLLLFCIRGNRINNTVRSNYKLFHDFLCGQKVPVAIVVTGLEGEKRMEDWWEVNEGVLRRFKIKSRGHVCITTLDEEEAKDYGERIEAKRRLSRRLLLDLITEQLGVEPSRPSQRQSSMDDDTLFALDLLKKMAALLKPKERLPRKQLTDVLTQNYGVTPRRAQEVVGGIAGIRWSRSPTEPSPQQTEVHPSGSHCSGFSRSLLIQSNRVNSLEDQSSTGFQVAQEHHWFSELSTEGPANLPSPTSEVPATSRAPRNLNVSGFKGVWRRATAKEPPEPKGTAVANSSRPQRSRSAPITSPTLNLVGDQSHHRARTLPSTLSRTGQQPTTSASTSTSWLRLASHALQRLQEYFRRHPSPNRVSSLHSSPAVNAIDLDTGSKPTAEPSSRTRPFA